jgi:molybdopterin molybdotransferase
MIGPEEAWKTILHYVQPLEAIEIPLERALGCCLAEPIRADRDIPAEDRSAMDGYAVRSTDLQSAPAELKVIGEVAAGQPPHLEVTPGSCVRIYTGASIPRGADAVAILEQAEERDGWVRFRKPVAVGENIFRRGEDAREGDELLPAGTRLGPVEIGICAAVGKSRVRVHRPPQVVILCTGSELVAADCEPPPWGVRNSLGPALAAALRQWGLPDARYQVVPDRVAAVRGALRRCLRRCDVAILTGGVSAGRYDYVPQAVEAIGATIRFHRVAMKPGKPTLYATFGENRHIFGLPGNPLSALTAFHEFALPALRRLSGVEPESCRPSLLASLAEPLPKPGGRVRYQLARLVWVGHEARVVPVMSHSSADLPSAGRTDGVVVLRPGVEGLAAGELVEFRPWGPWLWRA